MKRVFIDPKTKVEFEVSNTNLFSIYEREGYVEVDVEARKQEEKDKKKAEKERLAAEKLAKAEAEKVEAVG